jgi:hypothetical protein
MFGLYEKKNKLALHGIFDTKASAERHLKENIPEYCRKGYFTDKTLKPTRYGTLPSTNVVSRRPTRLS